MKIKAEAYKVLMDADTMTSQRISRRAESNTTLGWLRLANQRLVE